MSDRPPDALTMRVPDGKAVDCKSIPNPVQLWGASPDDDAYIIAVGRALRERGGQLQFDEAVPIEEGFTVTASLKASVVVTLQNEIAQGRATALKLILKGRSEL